MTASGIEIRLMTSSDLAPADRLREQARWNQTPADWRRMWAYEPDGCFVAQIEGQIVGTATTTRYGNHVAWIGMVLVEETYRRRGIGRELLNRCLAALQDLPAVQLDATPLGQPLYEKLGFRRVWNGHRWELESLGSRDVSEKTFGLAGQCTCRTWTDSDLDRMVELDAKAFGVPRAVMLQRLARDSQVVMVAEQGGRVPGFGMLRLGSRANYLGPVASESDEAAIALITRLVRTSAHGIFWDIPDDNVPAVALAERLGFKKQRPLVRMAKGSKAVAGNVKTYFAISDPALG